MEVPVVPIDVIVVGDVIVVSVAGELGDVVSAKSDIYHRTVMIFLPKRLHVSLMEESNKKMYQLQLAESWWLIRFLKLFFHELKFVRFDVPL